MQQAKQFAMEQKNHCSIWELLCSWITATEGSRCRGVSFRRRVQERTRERGSFIIIGLRPRRFFIRLLGEHGCVTEV